MNQTSEAIKFLQRAEEVRRAVASLKEAAYTMSAYLDSREVFDLAFCAASIERDARAALKECDKRQKRFANS